MKYCLVSNRVKIKSSISYVQQNQPKKKKQVWNNKGQIGCKWMSINLKKKRNFPHLINLNYKYVWVLWLFTKYVHQVIYILNFVHLWYSQEK